ncbi:MAG: amylo-alpha-1,6-glucosidase [Bacteroidales bacterium]|nr:amylo-alpha-1,6-glucosidase [Bacteroidales bacterium]
MCYLKLDKALLTNLQESMYRELLITNPAGAYCSTTVVGCNIRKYHGLLVAPLPGGDGERHVLLSSLNETVVQHGAEFNLAVHKYQGEHFSPKGHKYIVGFEWERIPTITYRIGGVKLKKELLLQREGACIMVRYTLLEAHSPTFLRLRPFLGFRSVRHWTQRNDSINRSKPAVNQGISMRLYEGFPELYMQLSKASEFTSEDNWYMGLDYPKERERGYHSSEDLYCPGYFEVSIKKGEQVVFTASLEEESMATIAREFEAELSQTDKRGSFYDSLLAAAHQFKQEKDGESYILAGYPWFNCRARDFFVSLPGFTLSIGEPESFDRYMATASKGLYDFMAGRDLSVAIEEIDQPDVLLWAIWSLQRYARRVSREVCYDKYGDLIFDMLYFIEDGRHPNLQMHSNGLLYIDGKQKAATWMNAEREGKVITPRTGYVVEINALWYAAVAFAAHLLEECSPEESAEELERLRALAEHIGTNFKQTFLNEYGYLLDYVDGYNQDWSVRPNMIFAVALDFSPLDLTQKKRVLDICTRELVTPKGIRSLSPKSGGYNPIFAGAQVHRDYAYHQGTAWPWLTGFYIEAYLKVYKRSGVGYVERQLIGYEDELYSHCVGAIPELFDGNPPYHARGAISFAMNVSCLLRAVYTLDRYNKG